VSGLPFDPLLLLRRLAVFPLLPCMAQFTRFGTQQIPTISDFLPATPNPFSLNPAYDTLTNPCFSCRAGFARCLPLITHPVRAILGFFLFSLSAYKGPFPLYSGSSSSIFKHSLFFFGISLPLGTLITRPLNPAD